MKTPKNIHLWKNKSGAYYFRQRLPECLRSLLGKTEIKIPLKTDSCKEARKLASIYSAEIHIILMGDKKAPPSLQEILFRTFPEAKKLADTTANLSESLLPPNIQQALGLADEQICPDVATPVTQEPAQAPETAPAIELQIGTSELLSGVVGAYLREMELTKRWKSDRGPMQVKEACELFIEMVGDLPIKNITKQLARQFKQDYMRLPSNKNKKAEYRGKSVAELLAMDIPQQDLLKPETVNNNLTRISTFFKWAVNNDYISSNPLTGLLLGKSVKGRRDVFDQSDLKKLFESPEYQGNHFDKTFQYWCPLIALYAGMRCEELARLQVSNFKQMEGIWCIQGEKGADGWEGKYGSGLRTIPLHHKLVELGLLDYVEQIKSKGQLRLFPELKPFANSEEYGILLSRWFSKYRKKCGVNDSSKTLHSFRHTLLNGLKQAGVQLEIAQAIAGHDGQSITYSHYGKDYKISVMKEAIDKADFGLNHPKFY